MVRISTIYDKINDKNEKVFMVRGDESYARTTKTLIDWNGTVIYHATDFSIDLTVDVLRDVGSSSITIYDGDDVLDVVPWTSTNSARTVRVNGLSYDVLHEISVRYNESHDNKECLGSKSDSISIMEENTQAHTTRLTSSSVDGVYESNQNVVLQFNLADISGLSGNVGGKTISVYVNDVLIQHSSVTASNGNVSINCGRLTLGKNTVHASFDGYVDTVNDYVLSSSEIEFSISVGKVVTIESIPQPFINGTNNSVSVSVKDYMNNPISNTGVSLTSVDNGTVVATGTTNSNGVATLNVINIVHNSKYVAVNNVYSSNSVTVKALTLSSINITARNSSVSTDVCGIGSEMTVNVLLEGDNLGDVSVPVTLTGAINNTIYTNSGIQGSNNVRTTYNGGANGHQTITARCGNLTATTTFDDVYEYWDIIYSIGKNYQMLTGGISQKINGYKIDFNNNQAMFYFLYDLSNINHVLEFKVVSKSDVNIIRFGSFMNSTIGTNLVLNGTEFNTGDVIRFEAVGNTSKVYVNNVEVRSAIRDNGYPLLHINGLNASLIINKLKLMRI